MKANGKDVQVSAATSRVPAPERRNLVADGEDSEMMDSVRPALQRSWPLPVLHKIYGPSAADLLGPPVHTGLICASVDQLFAARGSANGESREERVLCLPLRGRQVGSCRGPWHTTRNMPGRLEMCLALEHVTHALNSAFFPFPRFAKVRSFMVF
jgi:hypothetical protein